MSYAKTIWRPRGDPLGETQFTSGRMNNIEQGIADAHPTSGPTVRAVALGTAYRPNLNRPTLVATSVGANGSSQVDVSLGPTAGALTRVAICGSDNGGWTPCIFIVPAGYYYALSTTAGAPNLLGNAVTEIAL